MAKTVGVIRILKECNQFQGSNGTKPCLIAIAFTDQKDLQYLNPVLYLMKSSSLVNYFQIWISQQFFL
ncbi:unnamed protein product [Paramecium sonneborni]|uniref:Uncharacterized protein n=1 Tax=Paramecium sonneborni TaxID=65129 RepID=A0A8S1QHW7_9CILI|nr:unnamed protein product [Paramecium sonneborni]CAD8114055.1 unnamed protein product [Paramecium sonneborni]